MNIILGAKRSAKEQVRKRAPKGSQIFKIGGEDNRRCSFYLTEATRKRILKLAEAINCKPNAIMREAIERSLRLGEYRLPLIDAVKDQVARGLTKKLRIVK